MPYLPDDFSDCEQSYGFHPKTTESATNVLQKYMKMKRIDGVKVELLCWNSMKNNLTILAKLTRAYLHYHNYLNNTTFQSFQFLLTNEGEN